MCSNHGGSKVQGWGGLVAFWLRLRSLSVKTHGPKGQASPSDEPSS